MSGDNEKNGAETATTAREVSYPLYHEGKWYGVPATLRERLEVATRECERTRRVWLLSGDGSAYRAAQPVQAATFREIVASCPVVPAPVRA